jgi:hypothetical protein
MIQNDNRTIRYPRTVRYSNAEWSHIMTKAALLNMKPTTFVRVRTLSDKLSDIERVAIKQSQDKKEFAQLLSALGASRLSQNINQIALEMNAGTLIISPDITAKLNRASKDIQAMRSTLMSYLGRKR